MSLFCWVTVKYHKHVCTISKFWTKVSSIGWPTKQFLWSGFWFDFEICRQSPICRTLWFQYRGPFWVVVKKIKNNILTIRKRWSKIKIFLLNWVYQVYVLTFLLVSVFHIWCCYTSTFICPIVLFKAFFVCFSIRQSVFMITI